jgi:uncharacterized protein (UPF0212 family)
MFNEMLSKVCKKFKVKDEGHVILALDDAYDEKDEKGRFEDRNLMAAKAFIEQVLQIVPESLTLYECPECGARASEVEMIQMDGIDHFLCCSSSTEGREAIIVTFDAVETSRIEKNNTEPITPVIGKKYRARDCSDIKKCYRGVQVRLVKVTETSFVVEVLEGKGKGQEVSCFKDMLEEIPPEWIVSMYNVAGVCVEQTSVDASTEEEALQVAKDIFAENGFDLKEYELAAEMVTGSDQDCNSSDCKACFEAVRGCDEHTPSTCPEPDGLLCRECNKSIVTGCALAACMKTA